MPDSEESDSDFEAKDVSEAVAASLLSSLSLVDDPREDRGKRYLLKEVLLITIIGCMCGCDHAEALEDWAVKEREWLQGCLPLNHGTPSQDVFLRVLAAIDIDAFRQSFLSWLKAAFEPLGLGEHIAIDGQTHRGSGDRASGDSPIHMVNAFACEAGIVVGQVATADKSNEIKAIPVLLELLDLEGALVSIDAMGTQKKIVKLIRKNQADYLLAIKKNQETLYEETVTAFEAADDGPTRNVDQADPPEMDTHEQNDLGHGRFETRETSVIADFEEWVPSSSEWWHVKTLIRVQARREDVISGESSTEVRYYFSSRELTAKQASRAVRAHWSVENQLHWVLDVSFGQDQSQVRTRNAAENLATVRHFALNLIKGYSGDNYSVPRRRRLCDYDAAYREQLLAQTAGL